LAARRFDDDDPDQEPDLSDTTPASPATTDADAAKRQHDKVAQLLARPPVLASASVTLDTGQALGYAVRAAFIPVLAGGIDAQRGEPQAAVFTVAYLANIGPAGAEAAGKSATPRPVCFAFNGGPGSSSIWLHLGALGPKRVPVNDDGTLAAAPYAVVDNPLTWLAHFDLVFIDPPHTGWSVSASDAARKTLLSVDGDVDALAEVMRGWLAANGRFGAPLYLCGESYGTTRSAALADKLLDHGLALSGLILVSCAMDLQCLVFAPRNDLPYALFLPGFAATAQYHGTLKGEAGQSAEAARAAAEAFVQDDYLGALHQGARLEGRARSRIEKRLAELTGLALPVVQEHNLRISDSSFFVEALRPRGLLVGRLESRATAPMAAARERQLSFDPGIEGIAIPYTTAMLAYYSGLGLPTTERYDTLSLEVNKAWNWQRGSADGMVEANGFTSTSNDLARALRRNPHMKVLVASGRYDLGTPYSATDWSLAQLDAPAEVLLRVTHRYYDAGHMMYTRRADLAQLKTDLASWLG
jgi:carboxypeptidase C (cathepsin A)